MKFILWILLIPILSITGCKNPDPAAEATTQVREFLDKLVHGDLQKAYISTDPRLKSVAPFQAFADMLESYDLHKAESYTITELSLYKGVASVKAEVVVTGPVIVPLEMRFVSTGNSNTYACARFDVDRKQYFINQGMREPTRPEMETLTMQTLYEFQNACKIRDFEAIHQNVISRIWSRKTDPGQLREQYTSCLKEQFQLANFREARLNLIASSGVRVDGALFIKGEVLGRMNFPFELEYLYEDGGWKPIGMNFGL